jgi:hypothetical protein
MSQGTGAVCGILVYHQKPGTLPGGFADDAFQLDVGCMSVEYRVH